MSSNGSGTLIEGYKMNVNDRFRAIVLREAAKPNMNLHRLSVNAKVDGPNLWRFIKATDGRSIRLEVVEKVLTSLNLSMGVLDER